MAQERAPPSFGPPSLHCPDCGAPMRLLNILPSASPQAGGKITYRCEVCRTEFDDLTQQLLGAASPYIGCSLLMH
jgi:predicted RNA-binding Zn-ribbon protein involved in translation (DUF1610 family)